jgi:hypothetical protein
MANKVYYRIYTDKIDGVDVIEIHTSHIKEEVLKKEALSKRISCDSPIIMEQLGQWARDVENFGLIQVK